MSSLETLQFFYGVRHIKQVNSEINSFLFPRVFSAGDLTFQDASFFMSYSYSAEVVLRHVGMLG